jgi:hypothetical protein
LSFEIWIFRNCQPDWDDDRRNFVAMTSTQEQLRSFVWVAALRYQLSYVQKITVLYPRSRITSEWWNVNSIRWWCWNLCWYWWRGSWLLEKSSHRICCRGLYLIVGFNVNKHIVNITKNANAMCALRRNINNCSRQIKAQCCTTLIRPNIEYAATVWDQNSKMPWPKIPNTIYRATKTQISHQQSEPGIACQQC